MANAAIVVSVSHILQEYSGTCTHICHMNICMYYHIHMCLCASLVLSFFTLPPCTNKLTLYKQKPLFSALFSSCCPSLNYLFAHYLLFWVRRGCVFHAFIDLVHLDQVYNRYKRVYISLAYILCLFLFVCLFYNKMLSLSSFLCNLGSQKCVRS